MLQDPAVFYGQGVQIIALDIHGGMHIFVQRDRDIGMSQKFADAFDIGTAVDAVGRKGVA